MGENSAIQWTDHTFNPWIGCTKVSPGCANCYAEVNYFTALQRSNGRELWGKGKPRYKTSESIWRKPFDWNRRPWICENCGRPDNKQFDHSCTGRPEDACHTSNVNWHRARVFCASMADWLDDEVPLEWLCDLLHVIHCTPNLTWQLLTKRPENWRPRLEACLKTDAHTLEWESFVSRWLEGDAPKHVQFGTSVEDQDRADERIPTLLKIPAAVRFLSIEPLLGPLRLGFHLYHIDRRECGLADDPLAATLLQQACDEGRGSAPRMIHWAIIGGESGKKARRSNVSWFREILQDCRDNEVAPYVKQLGRYCQTDNPSDVPDHWTHKPSPTHTACIPLRDKKGGNWDEWPQDLRVREFPLAA